MRRPSIVPVVVAFVTLAACSGASPSELLTGPYAGDGGGSSSGGGSGGSSSGSSSGGSGSSSGGTSGSSSGGEPFDSGSGGHHDSGGGDDAGGMDSGPTGPLVLCPGGGTSNHCESGDFCCETGDANLGNQTFTCKLPTQSCTGVPIRCGVPADCPGQVCCGTQQDKGGTYSYLEVSCSKTCVGTLSRTFCKTSADCPANTPTCGPSQLLPGYQVCQ